MQSPKLDERLQAAYDLFSDCERGADIGADHGRLSCCLLESGKCRNMLLSDISADSLSKSRRLIEMHGLETSAVFCVENGLKALKAQNGTECVAICGMGGGLISRILEEGQEDLNGAALVLSSHTDIPLLRQAVCNIGYHIVKERLVRAKGRFYIIFRAEKGNTQHGEKEIYLGPCLTREKPPLWREYLLWREGVVACEKGHEKQLKWIQEELLSVK